MLKKISFALAFSLPLYTYSQEVTKDTTFIKEVMILENRLQIPFSKQSRNIQIIDSQEIRSLPVRSINEVLTYIAGVDVRQRGPFGTQADVSIDGGLFDQTLILLNGVKISDIQTGHHSMNIPVSLDAVDRIEVLKGPAARVYGINALTGAINIITKIEKHNTFSLNVKTGSSFKEKELNDGEGMYGGAHAQAVFNVGTDHFRNLLSVGYMQSNGIRYNSKADAKKVFYQGKYHFRTKDYAEIMLGYINNAFGANGYYAAPGDRESFEIVNTFVGSLGVSHHMTNNFIIKPRFSYRMNTDDYRYYRHDLSKGRSEHQTDALSFEINALLNKNYGDFGFGFESRDEKIESTNIGSHHRYNHGVFAEFKTEAIDKLYLNAGMYINYNTQYGWQVFPGIDASHLITPQLKASINVGTSQRLPSYTDLYLKQPKNLGNENLVPEKAFQYELSLRYTINDLYVQSGYFRRRINSFIDWVSNSSDLIFEAQNLGSNRIEGLYVGTGYHYKWNNISHFKIYLSYNYLAPKTQVYDSGITSKYILESLKHQLIGRINYHHQALNIGLASRWIERELNKPYLITDVKLGYQINSFNIYTEVNNLFNASYIESGAILLPGRWFSLGVKWNLKHF